MKNAGKIFEEDFKKSCQKEGIFVHRIKDNAMSYTESESVYTTKNDYDFLIYKRPILLALELKHTEKNSMSIQINENDSDKKMIKLHQRQGLAKAAQHVGVYAGFLLSFFCEASQQELTFFISIEDFEKFLATKQKKSINLVDIAMNGGIRVNQKLLRSHYHYEINELFNTLANNDANK